MPLQVTVKNVKSILTRTTGYLQTVSSHSLQPYVGCTFGHALCGVGCYVQHNYFLTRGRPWGDFLEVKQNAAERYLAQYDVERRRGHDHPNGFSIFMSSSTDPFLPQESKYRISHDVLSAMLEMPPDVLILQTHTHRILDYLEIYPKLAASCEVRCHISIESDRDRMPGLPPPASSVEKRFAAAKKLKNEGLNVIITASPLLPIQAPEAFFTKIAECSDGVVIDHFIGGDGSAAGKRTRKTALPQAMSTVSPDSVMLAYRDEMLTLAQKIMPGRVGVGIEGFAGRFLQSCI